MESLMSDKQIDEASHPSDPTPGRPKRDSSRQQTHRDQSAPADSASSGEDFTKQTGLSEQFKQPGAK
jgi:hypothetical protein